LHVCSFFCSRKRRRRRKKRSFSWQDKIILNLPGMYVCTMMYTLNPISIYTPKSAQQEAEEEEEEEEEVDSLDIIIVGLV
jgi:hypothetical protein